MPLYEYLCAACGERTEILQRFGDLTEIVCPSCGAPMRKLPSAPSIQFKGSGFYLTDYAKKSGGTEGASPRSGSDKGAEKSGDSGSSVSAADGGTGSGSGSAAQNPAPTSATAASAPAASAAGGAKPSTSGSGSD